jgi:hypothetical protein
MYYISYTLFTTMPLSSIMKLISLKKGCVKMNFETVVKNISTSNELKRTANAYVIDYRSLSVNELVSAINKTAPQYYHKPNVEEALNYFLYHA